MGRTPKCFELDDDDTICDILRLHEYQVKLCAMKGELNEMTTKLNGLEESAKSELMSEITACKNSMVFLKPANMPTSALKFKITCCGRDIPVQTKISSLVENGFGVTTGNEIIIRTKGETCLSLLLHQTWYIIL